MLCLQCLDSGERWRRDGAVGFVPSSKGELCSARMWCLTLSVVGGVMLAEICSIAQLWVVHSWVARVSFHGTGQQE